MVKKFITSLMIVFLALSNGNAQQTPKTLNAEQVLQLVKEFHPVAKQTKIAIEKVQAEILFARGAFDPVLSAYSARKTFDGTQYYDYTSPEIKVPTWYGVELTAGLESLSGNRFDPSETTGQTSFIGLNIPLAKNLLIDKRRASLQQAKIFSTMASVERKAALNDLLMNAVEAYWLWVKAHQTLKVIQNVVLTNEKRVEFVKKSYKNGERSAIDTLEAVAQLQSFQYQQQQYELALQNATLNLSAFLWKNNNEPHNLPETVLPEAGWKNEIPPENFRLNLADLLESAINNHPDLQIYTHKLAALGIEKKLKFQELLPKIDFRYNQLGKGYDLIKTVSAGPLFQNNFQYGLRFELPLRLSQGRSAFQQAKLKIEDTKLSQAQKRFQVELKVKSYYNEFVNLRSQLTLQSSSFNNYQQLVTAEESKFKNGESSLFLINSRESKALEALEKLIEVKTKYHKSVYALQWSAGLLQ